jgi:NitT/TauT family transport system substrate-binding protein
LSQSGHGRTSHRPSPPDATIALLGQSADITTVFSVPPFQLEKPGIRTVLNSCDVFGEPHTFTVAWTSARFRDQNPALYEALIAAFDGATQMLGKDVKEASRFWIENVKSKLTVEKVAEIASGKQVRWTMVPENTVKYAAFMHAVGRIKAMPADWKELFFPELHSLPGS